MLILVRPSPDTGKAKRETRISGYKTFLNGILVSDIVTPRHRTQQPNALSFPAREALTGFLYTSIEFGKRPSGNPGPTTQRSS